VSASSGSAAHLVEAGFEAPDGAVYIGEFVEAEESDPEGREVVAFTAHGTAALVGEVSLQALFDEAETALDEAD